MTLQEFIAQLSGGGQVPGATPYFTAPPQNFSYAPSAPPQMAPAGGTPNDSAAMAQLMDVLTRANSPEPPQLMDTGGSGILGAIDSTKHPVATSLLEGLQTALSGIASAKRAGLEARGVQFSTPDPLQSLQATREKRRAAEAYNKNQMERYKSGTEAAKAKAAAKATA